MGVVSGIDLYNFPKQGPYFGARVEVCFNYDTASTIPGRVVRDDIEKPGVLIIKLIDGRFVLSTECQWRLIKK